MSGINNQFQVRKDIEKLYDLIYARTTDEESPVVQKEEFDNLVDNLINNYASNESLQDVVNTIMTREDVEELISSGGGQIVVDNALSDTSANPVQNKVVKGAIDGKADSVHPHTVSDVTDFPSIPSDVSDLTDESGLIPTIADNLTTNDATQVLSAKQGKVLNDLIGDAITYINQ